MSCAFDMPERERERERETDRQTDRQTERTHEIFRTVYSLIPKKIGIISTTHIHHQF